MTLKRGLWVLWFIAMCFFAYQVFGWLGVLLLIVAGGVGAIAMIPINRKVREDERKARFRRGD